MTDRRTWKAWLRLNPLTKNVSNDYFAEVSTTGKTMHNEDIARIIRDKGSDLQLETLLDVLNHGDRIRRELLLDGHCVQTDVCHLAPRILGNWTGSTPLFDPKTHKITIDATPTADMRKALNKIKVNVLGVKADGGAIIGLVTDVTTGKTDGTLTPQGDLIITGDKIKATPLSDTGIGICFVATDGTKTYAESPFIQNTPKKIICRIPSLSPGAYTLKIVTRYSNNNTLLQTPRTLVYHIPLTVYTVE
jgi:hypothetical protein